MSKFINFLYEFMSVFFNGIKSMLLGIFNGITQIFNVPHYIEVISFYKDEFGIKEWVLAVIAIIVMIAILLLIVLFFYFIIRKYIRFRKKLSSKFSSRKRKNTCYESIANGIETGGKFRSYY